MLFMKKTYVINGPGKSGKDTFIKMCRLFLRESEIKVYSFTSIFPTKKWLVDNNVWDGQSEKTEEIRRKMVQKKIEMTENGDQPNHYLIQKIAQIQSSAIVFTHIREAENIEKFMTMFEDEFQHGAESMHFMRQSLLKNQMSTGVDLLEETMRFENYDFEINIEKDGLELMKDIASDFLSLVLDEGELTDFGLAMLGQSEFHKEFDDQMQAGIV